MQIKLSDYILEQSVSDQEISNILLEQAIAEANVAFSLCDAYLKQCMIEEMLGIEDTDIEDEFITESDETPTTTDEEETADDIKTEEEEVTTESDDITIDETGEVITEAAKSKKSKKEAESSSASNEESTSSEEKAHTQTKTYGATNPTKEKASDYQEKEPKEKGRVLKAIKATFKAIGKFMHVIAVKLGMVNDRIIRNNKRLVHCVNDSSTEEIQELAEYLKKTLNLKNDRELYRYYNFKTCEKILETLYESTNRFSEFVERFSKIGSKDSLDGTRSKKDENNPRAINFINIGLTEFVNTLHTLDNETSFDIGAAYDPTSKTYRFQDRIRDYIQFWDQRTTKAHIGGIIKSMDKISKDLHDLDIKWNYTMDYRKDPFRFPGEEYIPNNRLPHPFKKAAAYMKDFDEKISKTDLLRNRSESYKYAEIRSTIHEINAVMNGGGKRSITSRINDMNERYFAVYDFYNNKLLKEREARREQKEAS